MGELAPLSNFFCCIQHGAFKYVEHEEASCSCTTSTYICVGHWKEAGCP